MYTCTEEQIEKAIKRGREEGGAESTISINMGGKTILLYDLNDPENPIELAFQSRYGSIVAYRWFGDGYMMIGFSAGYLVAISTHEDEIGEELFSGRFHKTSLTDIAISPVMGRAATCGDGSDGRHGIKIIDTKKWKEVKGEAVTMEQGVGQLDETGNGPSDQLIRGFTSRQSESFGWNAVVRAGMPQANVQRTTDTVWTSR